MAVHSPVNGTTAIPWRSSRRKLSLLEQLKSCQEAWSPGASWGRDGAHAALRGTPAGSFLVVKDSETSQPDLLCVSAGAQNEQVLDYRIRCTGAAFQLSESRLSFSDLAQLVFFYSLTRDVLDVCLNIPGWIYSVTEKNKSRLSELEPETWLLAAPEQPTDEMSQKEPSSMMCSIQLTSTNGALCIINPLYLREHGDEWLTSKTTNYRPNRKLSTSRPWTGAGLQNKRAISLDQESSAASTESSGLVRAKSADGPSTLPTAAVVLRRPSRDSPTSPPHRASLPPSSPSTPGSLTPELQRHSSPLPQSPHRVSWIEDGVWLPPPRPSSSSLHPPSLELDSLSISSIEEEQESPMPSPAPPHAPAHRLADKVMHRFSAVGQALGGLVCPKKRLVNRVQELSDKKGAAFSEAVKGFVETTLRRGTEPGGAGGAGGSEFLQDVRAALTSLRETLLDYPEIQTLLDAITDLTDPEIDSLVERSIHRVTLKPVSAHLYTCIHASRTGDGSLERLHGNLKVLERNRVEELGGSAGVGVPDSVTLERIQQWWTSMHEEFSPNKKVKMLLKVCKRIYETMSVNSSSATAFGADDFLPCLTWVLLRSDLVTLQIDTDYMMELLDPTQLQGEGGYYLTTLYASLYYISSFRPRLAARQLSVEAQHSLNQWHRRRTLHCDQSRRSKNRRTIRRPPCRERVPPSSEAETGSKEGKEIDSGDAEESQEPTGSSPEALQTLEEEAVQERGAADQSQTPTSPCPPATQEDEMTSKQEDRQSFCIAAEEDHRGL